MKSGDHKYSSSYINLLYYIEILLLNNMSIILLIIKDTEEVYKYFLKFNNFFLLLKFMKYLFEKLWLNKAT